MKAVTLGSERLPVERALNGDDEPGGKIAAQQRSCCQHLPAAFIFDFDGEVLDSAQIKVDAYVKIYADENPVKVRELVRHAHLHGGTTRRVKFAQYERDLF
jgi:hypothetical protein